MTDIWLSGLMTPTPQEGYDLALKLARTAVKKIQPDPEVRLELRASYQSDPKALIAASAVVAAHFQTIAAANGYWTSHPTDQDSKR